MECAAGWLGEPLSNRNVYRFTCVRVVKLNRAGWWRCGGDAGFATTAANVFGALSSAWLHDVTIVAPCIGLLLSSWSVLLWSLSRIADNVVSMRAHAVLS